MRENPNADQLLKNVGYKPSLLVRGEVKRLKNLLIPSEYILSAVDATFPSAGTGLVVLTSSRVLSIYKDRTVAWSLSDIHDVKFIRGWFFSKIIIRSYGSEAVYSQIEKSSADLFSARYFKAKSELANLQTISNHPNKDLNNTPIENKNSRSKPRDERTLPEIAQAILEDGIITLEEAQSLKSWFDEGDRLKDKKSYGLYQILSESLKDNELSADESAALLKRLRGLLPAETPIYTVEDTQPVRVFATDDWKGLTIDCTYETAAGEISDRRLKVLTDNGYSIYCYCHLRHAKRTFVKHRVISAVDVDSGEILA